MLCRTLSLLAATALSLQSLVSAVAEETSAPSTTLTPLVSFVGADTRITRHEIQRILNQQAWAQFWLRHSGKAGRPEDYNQYRRTGAPEIDFDACMVIAITESPGELNAGIAVKSISETADALIFDYDNMYYQAQEGSSAPGNAFGYFVLCRSLKPVIVRHNVQDGRSRFLGGPPVWKEISRFPALATQAAQAPQSQDAPPADALSVLRNPRPATVSEPTAWNIVFAHDPGPGQYDGVVGAPHDAWNFVDAGTSSRPFLMSSDGQRTAVGLKLSETDGRWGITGHSGIFHGYVYHNCRCVDVRATLTGLPAGRYRFYVYAHGDAPDQNADVEFNIAGETLARRSTLNDGTMKFRSTEWSEGRQYVSFEFDHGGTLPVDIISHRAGSIYSMLNAIQVVRVVGPKK